MCGKAFQCGRAVFLVEKVKKCPWWRSEADPERSLKISEEKARKNQMFFIRISPETVQALLSDYRNLENEIYYYYGVNFLIVIYIFLLKTKRILFKNWIQMKTWTDLCHNRFRISMENLTIPAMLQVNHRNNKIFCLNPLLIRILLN